AVAAVALIALQIDAALLALRKAWRARRGALTEIAHLAHGARCTADAAVLRVRLQIDARVPAGDLAGGAGAGRASRATGAAGAAGAAPARRPELHVVAAA